MKMGGSKVQYIFIFMIVSAMIFYPKPVTSEPQLIRYENNNYNKNTDAPDETQSQIVKVSTESGPDHDHILIDSNTSINSNHSSAFFNNRSGVINFDLSSFLNDTYMSMSCTGIFDCTANYSTGWKDDTS